MLHKPLTRRALCGGLLAAPRAAQPVRGALYAYVGRFVYCSNRGRDSIATFTSDPRTGLLTAAGWTPSQGRTPRTIGFDPSHVLLCATNEQSDAVVTFRADAATGRLAVTGSPVPNASPACIAFAALPA
jgi:6-phosphogluconolactonase (cycloisomerase 2 family)